MATLKIRLALISLFALASLKSEAQNLELVGKTEEFIIQSVQDYQHMEERDLEHEMYPLLVFEDEGQGKELDVFFTFYQNQKICNMIRVIAPAAALKQDIDLIRSSFTPAMEDVWENKDHTIQVQYRAPARPEGEITMIIKALSN